MKSFFELIRNWAEMSPSKTALTFEPVGQGSSRDSGFSETKKFLQESTNLSYGQLWCLSKQWAHAIQSNVALARQTSTHHHSNQNSENSHQNPGTSAPTVLIALPIGPDFFGSVLGALGLGFRVAPVSLNLSSFEFKRILSAAPVDVFVTDGTYAVDAELRGLKTITLPSLIEAELTGPRADTPVILSYTFKGLGYPLPVSHSAREVDHSLQFLKRELDDRIKERHLLSLPLYPVYGLLSGMLAPLSLGAEIVVGTGNLRHSTLNLILEADVRLACLVPDMYRKLCKEFEKLSPSEKQKIRGKNSCYFMSGSSQLSPQIERFWVDATGAPILQGYGTTESLPLFKNTYANCAEGSFGKPESDTEVRLLDGIGCPAASGSAGELWIRSESLCAGYEKMPSVSALFFKQGWFRTGDLVVQEPRGHLKYLGTCARFSKVLGQMVDHLEIESLALQIPEVSEARVCFALPAEGDPGDPKQSGWAEARKLTLFVGSSPQGERLTDAKIKDHLSKFLSPHKLPRRIEVYNLPK